MRKICILSTVNLKHMTLISHYTSWLEDNGIKYDIIYIDKYDIEEKINARRKYTYKLQINRNWPFLFKLIKYWNFKKYAKKIINKNKYEYLIVWNSFTAFMFSNYLKSKYKGHFSLNIRDYAYEKIPLIFNELKKTVKASSFTTISSRGFEEFLPKHNYVMLHSLNQNLLEKCHPKQEILHIREPIKLSFIGYVRFFNKDKKILDAFGNDNRFTIQYFGEGSNVLEEYATDKGYKNVKFHGSFSPSETIGFLNQTDIINNMYGSGKIELDTALSIKLYYAAYMNIPIAVSSNTYMEHASKGFNFVVDEKIENLPNDLYEWYRNLNFNEVKSSCKDFLNNIEQDKEIFHSLLERDLI